MVSDDAIEAIRRLEEREAEQERLRTASFNPLKYITTPEALEVYVQERIRLHLDLIKRDLP